MKRFAFITTCMERLSHAQVSAFFLEPWIDGIQNHFIFVDFACPENSGAVIKHMLPHANIVQVPRPKNDEEVLFHKSLAQNLGARRAKQLADYFVFIDADTLVSPALMEFIFEHACSDRFMIFLPPKEKRDLCGFLGVSAQAFSDVRGFDERMVGWGAEDLDMRLRLFLTTQMPWTEVPSHMAHNIEHSDDLRTRYSPFENKKASNHHNLQILDANVQRLTGMPCNQLLDTPLGPAVRTLLGLTHSPTGLAKSPK